MATGTKLPVVMDSDKAIAGGVATLGTDGKLVAAQRPFAGDTPYQDGSTDTVKDIVDALGTKVDGFDSRITTAESNASTANSNASSAKATAEAAQVTANAAIPASEKAAASGVATLDSNSRLVQMPTADEVGARPDTWTPTAAEVGVSNRNLLDNWYFGNPVN